LGEDGGALRSTKETGAALADSLYGAASRKLWIDVRVQKTEEPYVPRRQDFLHFGDGIWRSRLSAFKHHSFLRQDNLLKKFD